MKKLIFTFIILTILGQTSFGQKIENPKQGKLNNFPIINGKASNLPKPEYTEELKNACAKGKVEVRVVVDENGNVIEAEAITGDELLWESSVKAAKAAKFPSTNHLRIKVKGILVYNFPSEKNCIYLREIINKRAKYLPKPIYPKGCRCEGIIKVRIVVNMNGDVIFASAVSGNPLPRVAAVKAARQTKFSPTFINAPPILVAAYLEYVFDLSGKAKV